VLEDGAVERGRALVGFDVDDDELRLRFDRGAPARARRLVLALPQLALEAVADHSPALSTPGVRALLRTVTGHPASKLAAVYDRAWWRDDGRDGARVVCDLDLSKVFYFDDPLGPEAPAILLASYADGLARDAWCARAPGWAMPEDEGAADAPGRWDRYAATATQVADAQRQLAELHDRAEIPAPVATAFVDWGAAPFGAAWHFWDAGVSSSDAAAQVLQPRPDLPVFICGEAYSTSQGWVEGALESATAVLRRLAGRD
jgi:monoamine oxidase